MESIFERMSRRSGGISTAIVDHGNPAAWHGTKATTTIACDSDEEVLQGVLGVIPSHQFTFARFTALAKARGCTFCCQWFDFDAKCLCRDHTEDER